LLQPKFKVELVQELFDQQRAITLFAHSVPGEPADSWEPLSWHLANVAASARRNAERFGAADVGEVSGWLHDIGKVKAGFQARLRGSPQKVSHSGEGARYAHDHFLVLGKLMAFCIAGHHSGLPNGATEAQSRPVTPLLRRLAQSEAIQLPAGVEIPDLRTAPAPLSGLKFDAGTAFCAFEVQFFTRMLFSALVDADFVETETFCSPGKRHSPNPDLERLRATLDRRLSGFGPARTPVNRLRAEVLSAAEDAADKEPGLFTLTVPTGGGKTLSSLKFAFDHARRHDLRRVIYVVPFTAIIEQTADVFRTYLEDEDAVL